MLTILFYAALLLVASIVVKAISIAMQRRREINMLRYPHPPLDFPWGNSLLRKKWQGQVLEKHMEYLDKAESKTYVLVAPAFMQSLSGITNEVITADARLSKHVLHDRFDVWTKSGNNGRALRVVRAFLGKGIFLSDHGPYAEYPADGGKMWHTQRKAASNIFTHSMFKTFYEDVFVSRTRRLVDILHKEGMRDEGVNILKLLTGLTFDCFAKIAFGANMDNMSGGDTVGDAFDSAQNLTLQYITQNIYGLLLCELLPWPLRNIVEWGIEASSSTHAEMLRQTNTFNSYARDIISRRRAAIAAGEKSDSDLLGLLLDIDKETSSSDEDLQDMLKHFIIAGRDTTASTLAFMFYHLGLPKNREMLKCVQEEVDAVLEGTDPTHSDMAEMPYLRGALWEALRLYPIVPLIPVTCKVDDTLPDGVRAPRGTRVLICAYAMARDKQRYGEDALEFRPDRWIPFKQPDPYEFPTFKAGRRICLGKDMALFEATVVAALLLQKFTPEVVDPDAYNYGLKLTLSIRNTKTQKDELWMRFKPRSQE